MENNIILLEITKVIDGNRDLKWIKLMMKMNDTNDWKRWKFMQTWYSGWKKIYKINITKEVEP